ncbi:MULTISPECIES: helix-turn-helix domain-containing protein [Leptospira]|uniref:DNA-binding helix-turn-helix protein n=1 Tax=Leptospira santarosai TaxID=28183 RepID=A0A2P1QQP7_9LEPT|nr:MULTISPECIES: helix-turn-helix transcriptional regulator [Leptospira]AVQ11214.1 DNA-binding helix-turn-helix protein [Leptospira santarosai]AVV79146.1 DNA-binding helix-turn-helix protein [Leptospira santarosai]MDI7182895.1 helix-turn-helix transcriptional regulator [Leptospira santarosai]MDO6384465.1 helix-turn-helix transcriptional regulator [Leptospira santarosai]ONF87054.1 transcriptional regulator [Leptospira santarosai serovar Grippotyphosa]
MVKNKPKKDLKSFYHDLESYVPKDVIKDAKTEAQKQILKLKLAELRQKQGIKQTDVEGFSQVSVSRIESRSDIKISTLVDYVHACGMDIEIKAIPRKKKTKDEFLLLKA